MLEVCFSDSVKGALHCAQHCAGSSGGATGFIGGDHLSWLARWRLRKKMIAQQRELDRQAISLGGAKEDLVGLSFDLSMGDIAAPLLGESPPRKQFIFDWFTADPWGELGEMETEAQRFWDSCLADLEKLKCRASTGESVRIWADNTPSASCGLLFVSHLLQGLDCPVTVVPHPPQYTHPDGTIIFHLGWGEVQPQLFGRFLTESRILSLEERSAMARQWQALQQENAPLRAVQEGDVISVSLDYYDDILRGEFPKNSCSVAALIGNVLGRHRLGIGDYFIAQRIRAMIANGELRICQESKDRFYGTEIASGC